MGIRKAWTTDISMTYIEERQATNIISRMAEQRAVDQDGLMPGNKYRTSSLCIVVYIIRSETHMYS